MAGCGTQLIMLGLALTLAGCASAPARFYNLDTTAAAGGAPASAASVMVGPVTIPAAADQPEFVVQAAANRVDVDEFNRWVAPLSDSIARAVAGDLSVLLGTPNVAVAPLADFNPAYRVTIDVLRFDSIRGVAVIDEAVWTVRQSASGAIRRGHTRASRPPMTASPRSLPPTAAPAPKSASISPPPSARQPNPSRSDP